MNPLEEIKEGGALEGFALVYPYAYPYLLPSNIYGGFPKKPIPTLGIRDILICRDELSEETVYNIVELISEKRTLLMRRDPNYNLLPYLNKESYQLSFPLHQGTLDYINRNKPGFLERYAEVFALVFSFGAVLYAAIQALRNGMHRKRKERIDLYFLEFQEIRSNKKVDKLERVELLDDLLHRALVQMTSEKLDITDFHIFSRLVQQELSNLR